MYFSIENALRWSTLDLLETSSGQLNSCSLRKIIISISNTLFDLAHIFNSLKTSHHDLPNLIYIIYGLLAADR